MSLGNGLVRSPAPYGGVPEWPKGADCKSVASRFGGSNPPSSTRKRQVSTETCRFQLYSPYGELYAPSVRDICFASDMPAGVRGEYNITETVGFNITFCVAKYITPSKTEYH